MGLGRAEVVNAILNLRTATTRSRALATNPHWQLASSGAFDRKPSAGGSIRAQHQTEGTYGELPRFEAIRFPIGYKRFTDCLFADNAATE